MYVLYHCNNSYASQKVRLFLAEKKIPWDAHHVDLLKQEHITEEYKKINPRGLVPALDDHGRIILNSTDIMQYLNERSKNRTLFDPALLQQIYDFSKHDEGLHDPHIRTLSYHYLWMSKQAAPDEISRVLAMARIHPDKARGEFLARAIQRQITEEEVRQSNKAIVSALEEMEQQLKKQSFHSEFIFGNEYTMADAVATARIFRLYRLNLGSTIEQYPFTLAYYQRMKQRPNFIEATLV
jgi:glutathione S-transferase